MCEALQNRPLTVAIPTKRGIVLMNPDSSVDSAQSRIFPCPAYHVCRKLKESYRSSNRKDYDQHVKALRDLLQPIKEIALRLKQLIESDIKEQYQSSNFQTGCRGFGQGERKYQGERNDKRSNPASELIIATTSTSVCALCGVAFHLKNPSKELREFTFDENGRIDDYNSNPDTISKNNLPKMVLYKTIEKDKNSYDIYIRQNFLNSSSDENNNTISSVKEEKIFSETSLVDIIERELRSKLLFVRQHSSEKISCQICQDKFQQKRDIKTYVMKYTDDHQSFETNAITSKYPRKYNEDKISKAADSKLMQQSSEVTHASPTISRIRDTSTLSHEMFCPCACGLLVGDEIESEVSIETSLLEENTFKTKLEELSRDLNIKIDDDTNNIKKTKISKLKKDKSVESWMKEIIYLQLQAQANELHKNIQFFKEENEYFRRLLDKCHCSPEKKKMSQLLVTATYLKFTAAIKFLRTKYHSKNGIIATLVDILQSSVNIERITEKLLTPFVEHRC